MKQDKKTISVRLPLKEYEQLKEMSDFFGVSLSQIIAMAIHSGLMLVDGVATKEVKQEDD